MYKKLRSTPNILILLLKEVAQQCKKIDTAWLIVSNNKFHYIINILTALKFCVLYFVIMVYENDISSHKNFNDMNATHMKDNSFILSLHHFFTLEFLTLIEKLDFLICWFKIFMITTPTCWHSWNCNLLSMRASDSCSQLWLSIHGRILCRD